MNSPSRRLEDLSTPSLDNESTYLLYQEGSHAIYWLGISNDSAFRCNVYLIKDGEQGLLVDPGGSASFLQIHTAVEAIMPTEQLDGMILCHQDPDVSASMVDWLKINPQMKVISSPRTHVLLPHYGASDYRVFDVEKHPVYCFRSGRQLRFIPAPFLHFSGAFVTLDTSADYLFSGDVWAALDIDWKLIVEDFTDHADKMDLFHKDYMASNIASRGLADTLAGEQIAAILPQHGSIIPGKLVPDALDYLRRLQCGLDLIYADYDHLGSEPIEQQNPQVETKRADANPSERDPGLAWQQCFDAIPDLSSNADQRLRQALAQAQRQAHLRDRALADLRRAEMQLEREHKRTEIIERMQSRFIAESDNFSINQNLLNDLLELTGSEFGLTGETNKTPEGDRYLTTYALSNLSWNAATRKIYEQVKKRGFEFHNLDNLLGRAIITGQPVISNDPAHDPRHKGFPKGHPRLQSFLGIPVYYGDRLVGEIGLANRDQGYDQHLIEFLNPLVVAYGQVIVARQDRLAREAAEKALNKLARLDGLLNIPNRRSFDENIAREWRHSMRKKIPVGLIMIDIDHFKRFNDHYGHQAGDECLIEVARAIQDSLHRPADTVARYGGEEFACILPDTTTEGTMAVAEKIQRTMQALAIPHEDSPVANQVTLSLGVAAQIPDKTHSADDLIATADRCLYQAKSAGRNRIVPQAQCADERLMDSGD